MKIKDIRELTEQEIVTKLEELKKELFNLRIQAKTGQLEKTSHVKEVRRDIAKVKTEINARSEVAASGS